MKINRKILVSVAIGIVIIAAVAITVPIVLLQRQDTLTDHEPIIVWSDMDFEMYDFGGLGTENDPYIIENYRINTTADIGIQIRYTTKHFVIRNCEITAKSVGIEIDNAAANTSIISNCVVEYNKYQGIAVIYSDGVLITNSIVADNEDQGILILSSNHVTIINNSITRNGRGVLLEYSKYCSLYNNTVYRNYGFGFQLCNTGYCSIKYNSLLVNNDLAMLIHQSSNHSIITYNLIHGNIAGGVYITYWPVIEEGPPSYNLLYHNAFIENGKVGFSHQALDDGYMNKWHNSTALSGNYWDDWLGYGPYHIFGDAGSGDMYPLAENPLE
jgi:parallel beta-helix repeat protein